MFSTREMPSPTSLFSAYASMTTSIVLIRSMANELIPHPIRGYLLATLRYFFKPRSQVLTLIIDEFDGISRNQVYDAAETYLCPKISPDTERLKVRKTPQDKEITMKLEKGEKIVDNYEGVELKWRFVCAEVEKNHQHDRSSSKVEKRYFELSFLKKHKETVLNSYLPFIVDRAKTAKEEHRVLKMHTLSNSRPSWEGMKWDSIILEHPATFGTLAMEPDLKNAVIDDLNRFIKRRKFYKRVGRAWKRGYLLHGPPGTGKSSLVAAMANYLKFDVYDLQLANVMRDSDLRNLLLATGNRSILVIEDIDCSVDLPDRYHGEGDKKHDRHIQLTLSGLLNFIDGLWSSCGDERIIVFTTNHKEKLDPALLRPGRMDMHIHMSYCTFHGFKLLASNYLEIDGYHRLYEEIEYLMKNTEVTPAQVAEELMKSEDADVALEGLVKLLKRKNSEAAADEQVDEAANRIGTRQRKRQKIEKKPKRPVRATRRKIIKRGY